MESNVYKKLMMVQQKLNAPKGQWNDYGKYHYRSCEDILEGLKPVLKEVEALVLVSDAIEVIGEKTYVSATATFVDTATGEKIENKAYARHSDSYKGMNDAQITGSTSSYARKYALNGLFAIDDSKDADTNEFKAEKDSKAADSQEQQAQIQAQEIGKKKINDIKVKAILNKCRNDNVPVEKVLSLYKVKALTELSENQFSNITMNWNKIAGAK